jgi:hypothetical protein
VHDRIVDPNLVMLTAMRAAYVQRHESHAPGLVGFDAFNARIDLLIRIGTTEHKTIHGHLRTAREGQNVMRLCSIFDAETPAKDLSGL